VGPFVFERQQQAAAAAAASVSILGMQPPPNQSLRKQQQYYVEQQSLLEATKTLSQSSSNSNNNNNDKINDNNNDNQLRHDDCNVEVVQDYFANHFQESPPTLFDMTCLKRLIQQHPTNIYLRTVFIRQYYLEYTLGITTTTTTADAATIPKQQQQQQRRHVVYLCHSHCGGFGDRLRAMMSSFFMALSLNATFTILTEYPVHWDVYFEPSLPELALSAPYNFLSHVGLLQSYHNSLGGESASTNGGSNDTAVFDLNATFGLQQHGSTSVTKRRINNTDFTFIFEDWFDHVINWGFEPSEVDWFRHLNLEHELTSSTASTADITDTATTDTAVALIASGWFRLQPYLFENAVSKDFVTRAQLTDLGKSEFTFIFIQLFMSQATPFLQKAAQPYVDQLLSLTPTTTATSTTTTTSPTGGTAAMKPHVVGVHVRLGDKKMGWGPQWRYTLKAVDCIADRIRAICEQKVVCKLWVTADNAVAINHLKKKLLTDTHIQIHTCDEGELVHTDATKFDPSTTDLKQANLRTFLDWYMLAKYTDELVITRSGFSEHAAFYTMKTPADFRPVWQLNEPDRKNPKACDWVDYIALKHRP
jgi:hypothetical protein